MVIERWDFEAARARADAERARARTSNQPCRRARWAARSYASLAARRSPVAARASPRSRSKSTSAGSSTSHSSTRSECQPEVAHSVLVSELIHVLASGQGGILRGLGSNTCGGGVGEVMGDLDRGDRDAAIAEALHRFRHITVEANAPRESTSVVARLGDQRMGELEAADYGTAHARSAASASPSRSNNSSTSLPKASARMSRRNRRPITLAACSACWPRGDMAAARSAKIAMVADRRWTPFVEQHRSERSMGEQLTGEQHVAGRAIVETSEHAGGQGSTRQLHRQQAQLGLGQWRHDDVPAPAP